jgi:xanthine dehydrogenase YagS FAD-binding subunit
VAAIVQRDGTGCVALGGVAHLPWRVEAAEAELPRGAKAVTAKLLDGAKPTVRNAFKLPLVERTLAAALMEAKG